MSERKGETFSILVNSGGDSLRNLEATGVILSNWNAENNESLALRGATSLIETDEIEIFWGYNGTYGHQLFPSQTVPFIIPVNNAAEISLRCRTGQEFEIWYSVIY